MKLWSIPKINPETVVCIGGGPSLTSEQVSMAAHFYTIAVNNAFEIAPWAQILYGCDSKWWNWYWETNSQGGPGAKYFKGYKVGLGWLGERNEVHDGWQHIDHDILRIQSSGADGLETEDPTAVRTGENSGYQAINLAVQLGAKRIILLGYDMCMNGKSHWHGEHPGRVRPEVESFLPHFASMLPDLNGVEIINCTPDTALRTFPMRDLEEVIG